MTTLVNSSTVLVDSATVTVNGTGDAEALATWRADISGVTYEFESYSLRLAKRVNERTAPQFDLFTDDGVHFERGEPVDIWHEDDRIAAGMVWTAQESYWGPTEGLRHRITVVDWHVLADRRNIARGYAAGTALSDIVRDIAGILGPDGVIVGDIDDGPTLDGQSGFNYVPCSQALDALAERAGYWWQIDDSRRLDFLPYTGRDAPWNVEPDPDGVLTDVDAGTLVFAQDELGYRNRQFLKGVKELTDERTERFAGDGETQTFTVGFPIASVPAVAVTGTPKTVGIRGIDTGRDWYWNKGDRTLTQDTDGTVLTSSDTLQVIYTGQFNTVVVSRNEDEITARSDAEGSGSGIWDHVAPGTEVDGRAEAFALAGSMLSYYGRDGFRVSYRTSTSGIKPGQLQTVTVPRLNLDALEVLVESVTYEPDGPRLRWTVEGIAGPLSHSWTHYFGQIQRQPRELLVRENLGEDDVLTRLFEFAKTWTEVEVPNIFATFKADGTYTAGDARKVAFAPAVRLTHVEVVDGPTLQRKVLTQRTGLDTSEIVTTQYLGPQDANGSTGEVVWYGGILATAAVGSGVEVARETLADEKTPAEAWNLVRTDTRWTGTVLLSAVADAANIAQFGGTVGDELALTFDGPLGGTGSFEVQFGTADGIPCSASSVSCSVVGSTLTVTASSTFLSSRDFSSDTVTAVDGLLDAVGFAVTVDSPVTITEAGSP